MYMYMDELRNLLRTLQIAKKITEQAILDGVTGNTIANLEAALFAACNALAALPITPDRSWHDLPACAIIDGGNYGQVIVSPYLPRRKNNIHESHVTCGASLDRLLRGSALPLSAAAYKITMIQVYPSDTPSSAMIDPDNIAIKRLVDNIAIALGVDDGGLTMHINMVNIVSDTVPPGMYTLIQPRDPNQDNQYYNELLTEVLYG